MHVDLSKALFLLAFFIFERQRQFRRATSAFLSSMESANYEIHSI